MTLMTPPTPPVGGWKVSSRWTAQDAFALEAMRPLGEAFLPWTGYALSPSAILKVLTLAEFYVPRVIVEVGAGLSTVFLARYLRYRGLEGSRLISIDNDASWVSLIDGYLEREDLRGVVELHTTRQVGWSPEDPGRGSSLDGWDFELPDRWYDASIIREVLGDDRIDLLLVDGPKGKGTITRYPALIELFDHLAENPTIILDDAARPPEQEILARWSAFSNFEFQLQKGEAIAIGRRPR